MSASRDADNITTTMQTMTQKSSAVAAAAADGVSRAAAEVRDQLEPLKSTTEKVTEAVCDAASGAAAAAADVVQHAGDVMEHAIGADRGPAAPADGEETNIDDRQSAYLASQM
eukprot:CAMPEP_0174832690 /NCGR_PEP_ID=MMETSP1114-20130205/3806_1 /TAXON_ID=312471 /ORGANISM="Neobodo designis, Strain CCAP 1951/1" /LENGTH=112 /DNA_ID=CAMNT_0016066555 /DNA_START=57 /DNA_END=395 /DNA_ORIENTATION=+